MPETARLAARPVNLLRAMLLGMALAFPCAFWLQYAEMVQRAGLFAVSSALPLPAVTGLLLLVCIHGLAKGIGAGRWLPREEILLVYLFLLISVPLASYGLAQTLLSHLTAGFHYAEPNNDFRLVLRKLPDWIVPSNPESVAALYRRAGDSASATLWSAPPGGSYAAWIVPILKWMVFLAAFFGFCLCLCVLLEPQWLLAERLRFPLTAPALELTASVPTRLLDRPLASNPITWLGVAWSVFYCGTSVVSAFVPTFTALSFVATLGPLTFYYRPIVLGLAYLAPTNLSLSIWVFELFKAAQKMLGDWAGLTGLSGTSLPGSSSRFPFNNEQALGAFLFIAAWSFWAARGRLWRALHAFSKRATEEESPRGAWALGGMLAFAGIMAAWLVWSGFWGGAVLCFLVLLILITVTHARIRAEAGPPLIHIAPDRSDLMLVSLSGSSHFSSHSLGQLSVWGFMTNGYFPFLMATQMDGLKIAREARVRRRDLAAILFVALFVGAFAGIWSLLYFWHSEGAENLLQYPLRGAQGSFKAAASHLNHRSGPDFLGLAAVAAGLGITVILAALRRWLWFWPLHPLGYAISQTSTQHLWSMFLVAWAVKAAVMRYGGVRAFRATVPFFFGVVFGQIGMLIVSNVLSHLYHVHIYVSAF